MDKKQGGLNPLPSVQVDKNRLLLILHLFSSAEVLELTKFVNGLSRNG